MVKIRNVGLDPQTLFRATRRSCFYTLIVFRFQPSASQLPPNQRHFRRGEPANTTTQLARTSMFHTDIRRRLTICASGAKTALTELSAVFGATANPNRRRSRMSSQPFFRSGNRPAEAIRSLEVISGSETEPQETTGPQGPESLLTVAQVAKRLGMSKQWVRDHIDRRRPKIDVVRWGSAVRFRPSDIDRFIREHINAPRFRRRRA